MAAPILATKLYVPQPQHQLVPRRHLIERLNQGLHHPSSLTLISAPAGFGKTTLIGEWITDCSQPAAWLSLDEGDSDPSRFLTYLISALQTITPNLGAKILVAVQSPQLPPIESILTILLNEITSLPDSFILVLDDFHV